MMTPSCTIAVTTANSDKSCTPVSFTVTTKQEVFQFDDGSENDDNEQQQQTTRTGQGKQKMIRQFHHVSL